MHTKRDLHTLLLHVDEQTCLRLPSMDEASALFSVVEANREHLRRFMWWVDHNTAPSGSEYFIRDAIQKAKEGAQLHLCIYHHGQIVGTAGFHYFDYINARTEIGYWLAKECEGRGIITKASRVIIRYAFETLGMHRVELRSSVENIRSRRIAERLGFKLEGIARESCKLASGYHDMEIFSLLSTEATL